MAALWLFLVAVVAIQFGYPISFYGQLWSAIYMLGYLAMIAAGLRLVRAEHLPITPFGLLAVLVMGTGFWFALVEPSRWAQVAMVSLAALFQLALLAAMSRFLIERRPGTTGGRLLLIAVSMYLLLGGVFAGLANLLETMTPGSYLDSVVPDRALVWQGLLYGSYVNLSTLGYGDIVPVSPWARSLSTLESVTGTLFLTIVIARLVGAYAGDGDEAGDDGDEAGDDGDGGGAERDAPNL